jgi:DNA-binding XRE family transcriptional regulator
MPHARPNHLSVSGGTETRGSLESKEVLPVEPVQKSNSGRKSPPSRLRVFRAACGLSQLELSRAVPCRQATISDLERGHHRPMRKLAEGIARVLGLDVREIFKPCEIFPPVSQTPRKKKAEDPRGRA